MNKRQAKKNQKKEMFLDYSSSYRDNRKIKRLYHEHCIEQKRIEKKCIAMGCTHYMKGFACFECFFCTKI